MLGNRLRLLRTQKKLTQEDVAKIIGVARTTYAMYEQNSREPDNDTLQKLADFFEVSTDYLLGRTDDPTPPSQAKGVVSDYSPFLRAIKEKYPGVNIDDPDVQRKLMRAIDLVLEDYLENKKRKQ